MPKPKGIAQARRTVERLLKIRLRSEKEIRDKLKQREFDQELIDQTLDYFRRLNLVNDQEFTRQWIHWRVSKPFGINRVKFELKNKGISEETIEAELRAFKINFPEDDIVLNLADRRKVLMKEKDPIKLKQRLYGYLLRRGFSVSSILEALKKVC